MMRYAEGKDAIAFFVEMRLGKTIPAIRWVGNAPGRHLAVAPLSVIPGWKEELEAEGVKNIHILRGSQDKILEIASKNKRGWFLSNYESLRAPTEKFINRNGKQSHRLLTPRLSELRWSTIILDESTKIRNPQSIITKTFLGEFYTPERRAILSGLPAPESPLDYFEQMRFLFGEFMGIDNYWDFRHRHFWAPKYAPYDFQPRMGVARKIKEAVHEKAFVLTRKEAGVGPEKIYEKRFVEMNSLQKKLYKEVNKTFEYNNDDVKMATKWATVKFAWLARIAGGFGADGEDFLSDGKAKELLELFQGELKEEKAVVWFRFNKEIEYVSEVLERAKIKHLVITGKTSFEDRLVLAKKFREKDKIRVILAQVKCGKFGMDFSKASTAIYYSNNYDMEDRAQSEDRILHVDKKDPLLYVDLVTKATVDVSISRILRNKYASSREFMSALVKDWLNDRKRGAQ